MKLNSALQELEKSTPPIQPVLYTAFSTYEESPMQLNTVGVKKAALFYQFKTRNNLEGQNAVIFPDACINILFNCNDYKKSAIYGLSLGPSILELEADTQYFGFKPYSTSGLKIQELQYSELVDNFVSFYDHYPETNDLQEKLASAVSMNERILALNQYAEQNMIDYNYDSDFIDYFELLLCSSSGSVDEMNSITGYSNRYCRKVFKDKFGVSPKQYSNVMRFQNSMKDLIGNEYLNLSDLANENGYYDQSHFIRDFQRYTNTPPEFFRKNFRTDYPPIDFERRF